jgi:hypothetical protein
MCFLSRLFSLDRMSIPSDRQYQYGPLPSTHHTRLLRLLKTTGMELLVELEVFSSMTPQSMMLYHIHWARPKRDITCVRTKAEDAKGQVGTQSLSCCLSTCGRKPIRLGAGPCSSACVLRAESCLGTCQRSTPKACPLSCMSVSAIRPGQR